MYKIMIVDDDTDLVDSMKLVLEKAGYKTCAAHTRQDAQSTFEMEKPDLIVLDVMMEEPDDGIVLAQWMRRKGFKTPILMLTSISKVSGLKYDKDDSLVPVNDFYEKPIEPAILLNKVKTLLNG